MLYPICCLFFWCLSWSSFDAFSNAFFLVLFFPRPTICRDFLVLRPFFFDFYSFLTFFFLHILRLYIFLLSIFRQNRFKSKKIALCVYLKPQLDTQIVALQKKQFLYHQIISNSQQTARTPVITPSAIPILSSLMTRRLIHFALALNYRKWY